MMGRIGAVRTRTYPEKRVNFSVNCHFFTEFTLFFSDFARNPLKTAVYIIRSVMFKVLK